MKKVYISGAISGLPIKEVIKDFGSIELAIKSMGLIPVNPLNVCPFSPEKTWNDYMKEDIKALVDCDYIVMMEGWETSRGARLEKYIAKELGIEIIILER